MSSSNVYALHYFNGRGRGEVVRLVLTQAGQKFEDRRYSFDDWAGLKSQMPLGQLPVLEINGEKYPQSMSISRHLARQFKLTGKDELDATKCDIIADTVQEINDAYFRAWFQIKDEKQKQDAQTEFKTDLLPQKLKGLEKLMKSYGDGTWAVGSSITWADLLLHTSIENLLALDTELLGTYATIKKNREAVEKSPKIAEYLKNRKETPF